MMLHLSIYAYSHIIGNSNAAPGSYQKRHNQHLILLYVPRTPITLIVMHHPCVISFWTVMKPHHCLICIQAATCRLVVLYIFTVESSHPKGVSYGPLVLVMGLTEAVSDASSGTHKDLIKTTPGRECSVKSLQ